MLRIELSELWNSYRSTTVAADAIEHDVELAWSAFHGGIFAFVRVLAHMDAQGKGEAATGGALDFRRADRPRNDGRAAVMDAQP